MLHLRDWASSAGPKGTAARTTPTTSTTRGPNARFRLAPRDNNEVFRTSTPACERGREKGCPLLAQNPLHSIRPAHDVTSAPHGTVWRFGRWRFRQWPASPWPSVLEELWALTPPATTSLRVCRCAHKSLVGRLIRGAWRTLSGQAWRRYAARSRRSLGGGGRVKVSEEARTSASE
jgi:hypothetical protein